MPRKIHPFQSEIQPQPREQHFRGGKRKSNHYSSFLKTIHPKNEKNPNAIRKIILQKNQIPKNNLSVIMTITEK
jgi:hypothetical protein